MSLRRWWNGLFHREIEFQVLKSTSSVELSAYGRRVNQQRRTRCNVPRYYSAYDTRALDDEVKQPGFVCTKVFDKMHLVVAFYERPDCANQVACKTQKEDIIPVWHCAQSTMRQWQDQGCLQQAFTLQSIEKQTLYPCVNIGVIVKSDSSEQVVNRLRAQQQALCDEMNQSCSFGTFEEIASIVKKGEKCTDRLPQSLNSGYVLMAYKLLAQEPPSQALEESWISWTGAKDIYFFSMPSWQLQRITFHRAAISPPCDGFAYLLLCQYANLLEPANILLARELAERLRARNTGYVALYSVLLACSDVGPAPPMESVAAEKQANR